MAVAPIDDNSRQGLVAVSSADGTSIVRLYADPTTHRLLVDLASGSGTVTSVSVVTANGFAGTVATATTTPAITLTTTINSPVLAGNGTALIAATTTGSGSTAVLATAPTFPTNITVGAAAETTGSILLKGTTSGTVTLSVADAAGTYTLKLPTTDGDSGQFLQTDGSGNTTWAAAAGGGITIGTTTITSGTDTRILYDNAGVVGEYTLSGSGTVVAMQTSPQLITPNIGVATGTSLDVSGVLESGANGATGGQLKMFGATSGDVTLRVNTTAGTATVFQLPNTNGSSTNLLQTDGAGVTSWVAIPTAPVATTITVANEATDTTCFPVFVTAATGDLGAKSNAGLTFNSSTASLGATLMTATTSLTTATVRASSNDSGSLGASGTAFSDLFLASGAVIDFAAGNSVITHSSAILTVSTGDLRVTTAGTNTASVVTVGGTQTLTAKTLTSPTITTATLSGAQQLAEGASIRLDATLSADGTFSGTTISGTAGATLAFGDLVYLAAADSRWELADADSVTTAGPVWIGMCVLAAAADGDPTVILLNGNVRADAAFPALTISAPVYVGTTAGDIQVAAPTGDNDVVRIVGHAITADSIYFNPSTDWVVLVV